MQLVSNKLPDLSKVPAVDEVGVNERVARFQSRSIKGDAKIAALRMILSMIDLTTLEGQDTPGKVGQLCRKALHLHDALPGLPNVAAVGGSWLAPSKLLAAGAFDEIATLATDAASIGV